MAIRTPEQVAAEAYRKLSGLPLKLSGGKLREIMTQAIEFDRAQRDTLPSGRARFVVEFDAPAWASASESERQAWLDEVTDDLAASVYVASVEIGLDEKKEN